MIDEKRQMNRPCAECPWRRDVAPGKFPLRRFLELRATCQPGGLPQKMFACHMSKEGDEVACAGMLKVVGATLNSVRRMMLQDMIDLSRVASDVPLYASFDEMAAANGAPMPAPNPARKGRWSA